MSGAPLNSFLRFLLGFMLFISMSLGVTFAVNSYATSRDAATQQAAAAAVMLGGAR
jgi:hypothetical protein